MRVVLLVLISCNQVSLPTRNDPAKATAFHCTVSQTDPYRNVCTTDAASCGEVVRSAASNGAFMSPCFERTRAFCAVATFDSKEDVFVCGPDRPACSKRRQELIDNRHMFGTGECVEQTAGGR